MDTEIDTPFTGISPRAFRLLAELDGNNERAWVRAHRHDLDRWLRQPFVRYLEATTKRLAAQGHALSGGAATMFRMQRDLRFTRDKRPVHPHVEGVFSEGQRRIGSRAAIHVRLDRSGGFLAAGSFLQPSEAVRALRESMVAREARVLEIVDRLASADVAIVSDKSLKNAPRGFECDGGGALGELLRMRTPTAKFALTRSCWRSGDVVERTALFADVVRPWLLFQKEALRDVPWSTPRPPRRPTHRE